MNFFNGKIDKLRENILEYSNEAKKENFIISCYEEAKKLNFNRKTRTIMEESLHINNHRRLRNQV